MNKHTRPQAPSSVSIEEAFGTEVAQRAQGLIQAQQRLGGNPSRLFAHQIAAGEFIDQMQAGASPLEQLSPMQRLRAEAAKRVARAAVQLLDTADASEVLARAICELHVVAWALGAQVEAEVEAKVQPGPAGLAEGEQG